MSPQSQPKCPQRQDNDSCYYEPSHVSGSLYEVILIDTGPGFVFASLPTIEVVAVIPPERA